MTQSSKRKNCILYLNETVYGPFPVLIMCAGGPPVFCLLCLNCAPNYWISKKLDFSVCRNYTSGRWKCGVLMQKKTEHCSATLFLKPSLFASGGTCHTCAWHSPVFSPSCSLVMGARVGALDRELENLCCSRFMPLVAVNSVMLYQVLTLAL